MKINFSINEIAREYVNYLESKYDNIEKEIIDMSNIRSNILKDCEFHIFETFNLSKEVEKILKNKNIKIINEVL